jgi:hypothetical protein
LPVNGAIDAILRAGHGDPFAVLGMHREGAGLVIRAFLPQASRVVAIDAASGTPVAELERVEQTGFFEGAVAGRTEPFAYRLRLTVGDTSSQIEDPYRFGNVLGDLDVYLIGEGRHRRLYEKFGAHPMSMDGVAGVAFAVWAPNARRVSVVGDFNDWDGRRHPMRFRIGAGVWETAAAQGRSVRVRERTAAGDRVHRCVPGTDAWTDHAWLEKRETGESARRADLDLRSAPRLLEARRRQPLPHLSRTCKRPRSVRRRSGLHAHRADAGFGASVRRFVGLSADRPVRANQPFREPAGLRGASSIARTPRA